MFSSSDLWTPLHTRHVRQADRQSGRQTGREANRQAGVRPDYGIGLETAGVEEGRGKRAYAASMKVTSYTRSQTPNLLHRVF